MIDPWPPNRGRRRPERLEFLAAMDRENVSEALTMALRIEPGWLDLTKFAIARNIDTDRIKDWAAPVSSVALSSPRRHYLFEPGRWSVLRESILDAVARYHTAFPASPGIEASRLRVALLDRLPVDLFDAAVTVLQKERAIEVDGPWLKRHGHFARLAAADDRLWQQIEPMLGASDFAPPRVRDLAVALKLQEGTVRSLLKRQAQMRRVIEVAQDHFYLLETVRNLAAQVAQLAARNGGIIDTAAFRDRIGTGRKIAIQILEYFDKTRLTFRKGEVRTIRAGRIDQFATIPNSE